MSEPFTIVDLRREMGLSQSDFAPLIGLTSKGYLSTIERENCCALSTALRIEEISGGRINAADLNEDVRAAREACRHGCADGPELAAPAAGNISADSRCADTEQEENSMPAVAKAAAGEAGAGKPDLSAPVEPQGRAA